jgi:hypothetical protein
MSRWAGGNDLNKFMTLKEAKQKLKDAGVTLKTYPGGYFSVHFADNTVYDTDNLQDAVDTALGVVAGTVFLTRLSPKK